MEPTEALRRLALFCLDDTGIIGGAYPTPGTLPKFPAIQVKWTTYALSSVGGLQELIARAEVKLFVVDILEANKVIGVADPLVVKLIDRFRPDRDNPAATLTLTGEEGNVKHCKVLSDGQVGVSVSGWGSVFYGAILPVEIKIHRVPEVIP